MTPLRAGRGPCYRSSMLRLLPAALAVLALACGGDPATDPTNCEAAPLGPSGGASDGTITLCVFDDAGNALSGAAVSIGGTSAGTTDATGRLDVDASDAIEVSSAGLVSHTLLGVTSRRFGVVLPRGALTTRTVSGTVTGISDLPAPEAGYRRVVQIRAGSAFAPLPLVDELTNAAPADCTLAGDECTFTIEVDDRVSRVNATVIDTTMSFADVTIAGFAISDAFTGNEVEFALPGREGGLEEITLDAGPDVVVGVPGARVGDDVLLFSSPTSTATIPVPDATVSESNWLAVIYDAGAADELEAGVVIDPDASTRAPPAPGISITGAMLQLPSARISTVSLGRGSDEVWRATVLDGRSTLSLPSTDADRVAVMIHTDAGFSDDEGVLDRVEAVVSLPDMR